MLIFIISYDNCISSARSISLGLGCSRSPRYPSAAEGQRRKVAKLSSKCGETRSLPPPHRSSHLPCWRDPSANKIMERTLPFRILIRSHLIDRSILPHISLFATTLRGYLCMRAFIIIIIADIYALPGNLLRQRTYLIPLQTGALRRSLTLWTGEWGFKLLSHSVTPALITSN